MLIDELNIENSADWDSYVKNSSTGLPTQLSAWKQIITKTYGHRCYFLYAHQAEQILGVLPLYLVKSPFIGRHLNSLPGAICTESAIVAQSLYNAADALARDLKADSLFLSDSRHMWSELDLECVELQRGIKRLLSTDLEANWNSLSRNLRHTIRHGQKNPSLSISVNPRQLQDFYNVFLNFTHEVGTPLYGFNFLNNVIHFLPDGHQIVVVYFGDRPVAAFFNFLFNKTIYGMWGASLREFHDLNTTYQAYWAIIEWGCQSGYSCFDLGRSPYPSGAFNFKSRWGEDQFPIYQFYKVYRGRKPLGLQVHDAGEEGSNIAIARKIWKKMPLSLVRALGPKIRWNIPFG
jgi:serine/alanine adding enzyme